MTMMISKSALLFRTGMFLFDLGYTRIISGYWKGVYHSNRLYRRVTRQESRQTQNIGTSIDRASLIAREGKNNLIKLSLQDQK